MAAPAQAARSFDPVDTSFDPAKNSVRDEVDTVESPSLSSSNVLARFEFEPGRSKDGTKVLMLEWEDDAQSINIKGDWEITWEGKRTVLPANDAVTNQLQQQASSMSPQDTPINRLYFLLGAGVPIPSQIILKKGSLLWKTNPLPAIFSPELGATATQAGKKGVLHTIWAKKRLSVLQSEIAREEKSNVEGIGLEMAHAEKEWIEQNFGVAPKPTNTGALGLNRSPSTGGMGGAGAGNLNSPTSPRSPGGGRLMDKLRGLKIDTQDGGSSSNLVSSSGHRKDNGTSGNYHNPLSPESSDVAVGSFGAFAALKGMPTTASTLAAKPPQPPSQQQQPRIAAVRPPEAAGGMGSLNAAFAPPPPPSGRMNDAAAEDDREDDLFALPMSPRSPEMTKSPFSMLKG